MHFQEIQARSTSIQPGHSSSSARPLPTGPNNKDCISTSSCLWNCFPGLVAHMVFQTQSAKIADLVMLNLETRKDWRASANPVRRLVFKQVQTRRTGKMATEVMALRDCCVNLRVGRTTSVSSKPRLVETDGSVVADVSSLAFDIVTFRRRDNGLCALGI